MPEWMRPKKDIRALRIATWNVNSVRQRITHLLDYLKEASPDALCLQEIKCTDDQFPRMEIEDLGYNVETHGQKGFNGVAILAKRPFEVARGLPGDDADTQSRYIEAVIPTETGGRRARRQHLPAERQSARQRQIPLQARLHGPARAPRAQSHGLRGAAGAGGRLQRHPRGPRRRAAGTLDE